MVNICMKCAFWNNNEYCERLGIRAKRNENICEYYIKNRGKIRNGESKN